MGKNKGEMKYHTLKESLKNDILSGVYQPGDKMPSENQLVQEYDLSRHPVRQFWKKKVILLQFMERERFVQNGHFIKRNQRTLQWLQPIFLIIYSLD